MIKNYIKFAVRQLWSLRLFTALNILGLAIGVSSCWLIYRVASYEFSFDSAHPEKEQIVKVITNVQRPDEQARYGGVAAPLYQALRTDVNGIKEVVPTFTQWTNRSVALAEDAREVSIEDPKEIIATDAAYFRMLPYQWLAGTAKGAFASPNSVVLTASRAKIYFPNLQPKDILNQTITYFGQDTLQRTVTAVVADYDSPSEFTGQEFVLLKNKAYPLAEWTNTNGSDKLYLQLQPETNRSSLLAQINALSQKHWDTFNNERESPLNLRKTYEFRPLPELHFATDINDYGQTKTNKTVIYGLIAVGIFLLLLACINYINISIAQIPQRSKEIGVRKTLGSSNNRLIFQFLFETFATTLCSFLLAVLLGQFLFFCLKDIIPAGIPFIDSYTDFFAFLFFTLLAVTILAGLYPAWLSSRVKTILILKNAKLTFAGKNFSLQKVLIVFQFVIAQFFIVSAIIVGTQLRYLIKSDMGFNKEAIVLFNVPWNLLDDPQYENKHFTLFDELHKQPGIAAIALGREPLSAGYSAGPYEYHDETHVEPTVHMMHKKVIDKNYLDLYKMELIAGRNLRQADTIQEYIINERAANSLGFPKPEDALGKLIGQPTEPKFPIVGVVKDFHTQNFYAKIEPLILMSYKENLNVFNIKLQGQDPAKWSYTIAHIQESWHKFYPTAPFEYRFYDDALANLYTQERRLSTLVNLATAITVIISCLGLFGISTLMAFQRTKEIGIRKVLGSSVFNIVRLLSVDFTKLVGLAIVIGSPAAWWATQNWLQDFVYRIDIAWWMFGSAGLCAIAIALITMSYQSIRAARANPVDSLRDE